MAGVLLGVVGLLLLACAGLLMSMYWQQRSLIYFPQSTRVEARATDFSLDRGDVVLRGWLHQPGRPRALLYFGGNAEPVQANAGELMDALPGHTLYLLAYRGYGASEGRPTEALLLGDALALYDEVRRLQPGAEIDVIGRSLGSGVASHLAAHRPVARLVMVTPFDSLAGVAGAHYPWLPVGLLMRDRYESWRTLPLHRGRLLVIRAGRDEVVPAASAARLLDVLPSPPQLLVIEAADHNDLSSHPAYWDCIGRFLGAAAGEDAGRGKGGGGSWPGMPPASVDQPPAQPSAQKPT